MTFFYDLNKKLDKIRATPELKHGQLNERDEGKPGKNFEKIAKDAGERYGSKAAGERVAGAVRNKLKAQGKLEEEGMSRAAKGYEKYGKEGMKALAKAGREGKALDPVRNKYNKYDEGMIGTGIGAGLGALALGPLGAVGGAIAGDKIGDAFDEDMSNVVKKIGSGVKKVGQKALDTLGHGSDEDMIRDLQRKAGLPQTGKKPTQVKEGDMENRMHADADRMSREQFCAKHGDENGTFWDSVHGNMDEGNAFSKAVVDAKRDGVQPGEKIQVGGKEYPVKEAAGAVDFDKVLDAIAALYGDDIWENDAMQDLANDLEQAGPTDRELDFIIAKGKLPKRLAGIQFSAGDDVQFGEASSPMTAKQKSFAALAEPRDKITFADKIAGAKQEVDEMLGDVAAEAMKNAVGKMGAKSHQARTTMKHVNASNASPKVKAAIGKASKDIKPGTKGYSDRAAALKAAGVKGAPGEVQEAHDDDDVYAYQDPAKAKTHKTASGGTVTRHGGVTRHQAAPGHYGGYDPESHPDKDDDKPGTPAGEKRGKGRPKGTGKSIGAKVNSGKSKLMTRESEVSTGNLQQMHRLVTSLRMHVQDEEGRALLKELLSMIKHYSSHGGEQELDEKAVSKKQQKFMGMVHAAQKGGKPASKEVAKVAKGMGKKDAEDFASTKHKGLPEKKAKKKEVEETTVAGSVATAPSTGKSNGMFGKGVYEAKLAESFNARMSELNESMNINASTDSEGHNSITVSATDEDAGKLAQILKLAGIGGSEGYSEVCPSCGSSKCGCEQVDEELANSADNTEYAGVDTMTKTLSGGLNGPKTTGQTTVPVINRDPARGSIGPVAESQEARLWELYQRYSTK